MRSILQKLYYVSYLHCCHQFGMERNLVRPSACCTWRTWFLVCDHRGCWAHHLCYKGMFLDYWFFQCFALLQVPWKTIVFFSRGESVSAARLGSSKGLGRQVGQMLSGAVGMHVLYNWSLDNSWQLMPVLSYANSIQIAMSNKRPYPIEFEPWTWKRTHSRWDRKAKCTHTFPCFNFVPSSAAQGGFIGFLWCFIKEPMKILQVLLR